MSDTYLVNTVRFYLRWNWRLKRARLAPIPGQPEWVEAEIWAHARQAADRLERLCSIAGRQTGPVERGRDLLPAADEQSAALKPLGYS